jgi:hypothetical protein
MATGQMKPLVKVSGCYFSEKPTRAPSQAGFSNLGDWVCPRMFFLGSEQTEINTTGFFFKNVFICVNHG